MWTMWNSLANTMQRLLTLAFIVCLTVSLLAMGGCTAGEGSGTAKARPVPAVQRPPSIDRMQLTRPVRLRSAQIRRFAPDEPRLSRLVNPAFFKVARQPLVIELQLAEPVDPTPRTSSPVIVLNGKVLSDTWVDPDNTDRLIAILPDRSLIQEQNSIAAAWLGNEEATLTRQPLTFSAADIKN